MINEKPLRPSDEQIRALAEFRFTLRKFLHFSEEAAIKIGLAPQQHQLMLQIAGSPKGTVTAVGYLAERLSLRHNSVVELSKRCEDAGLIARRHDPNNRRQVILELTSAGDRMLRNLSADHSSELNELGPQLIESLTALTNMPTTRRLHAGGSEEG
jgi:DNA-binding MarR family transcriptional regulator